MNDEYYNPNKVYTNSMGQLKPLEDMRSDFGVEMKVHPQTFVLLEGKQKVGYVLFALSSMLSNTISLSKPKQIYGLNV